jgi:hypothetical protein
MRICVNLRLFTDTLLVNVNSLLHRAAACAAMKAAAVGLGVDAVVAWLLDGCTALRAHRAGLL